MPKGYVIITEDVKDAAGMAEYGKLASQTMGNAKVLAFGPAADTLEGGVARHPDRAPGVRIGRGGEGVVLLRRVPGGREAAPGSGGLQWGGHRLRLLTGIPPLGSAQGIQ